MNTTMIVAPVALVQHPQLSPSAKLIGMLLQLPGDHSPTLLATLSGLARNTVLKGLGELTPNGWHMTADLAHGGGATVSMPTDLLPDRRVGIQGKLLYAQLQLLPGFRHPAGRFSYTSLTCVTHATLHTVKRAVRQLAETGWLQITQKNQLAPVNFSLCNPATDHGQAEVARVRRRLKKARYYAEALMREYLSLLVASDQFQDDAAPGFLVNPLTDERMQFDRFYPPNVAFEYNGPQHYGPTEWFSAESSAQQQARDLMKLGICARRGITLVIIHAEDLKLEIMQQKVGQLLPLGNLRGHERLIAFLDAASREYRTAGVYAPIQKG
jgi:hypothetical protein